MIDRKLFFASIRNSLFSGRMGKRQVEGLNAILNRWEGHETSADARQLAYILATAYHETAHTFQPIKERGGTAYLRQNYDVTGKRPRLARANGNTTPGDGARFAGRGFVQLTWRNNYRNVGRLIGIDLEAAPQLAMQPETAAIILVRGMREGWFTGRKLSHYFNTASEDWINARRIVNGLDRARTIAVYGKAFLAALGEKEQNGKIALAAVSASPAIPRSRRVTRPIQKIKRIKTTIGTSPYPQVPVVEGGGQ